MGTKLLPILMLAVLLAASGCAPRATESAYRNMLESYRGQHIDSMVAVWGPAQGHHTFADGRQLYSFVRNRREYVEAVDPLLGFGLGFHHRGFIGAYYAPERSRIREYSCETRVTTDRKGRIIDLDYRGNACRALPPEPPERRTGNGYRGNQSSRR